MLELPPRTGNERLLVVLISIVLVTFVLWGSWLIVAVALAATSWVFDAAGRLVGAAASFMASARGIAGWIAAACGAVLGVLLVLEPPIERLWGPLRRYAGVPARDAGEESP